MLVESSPDGETLSASSPDELALVNAARYFGYHFRGRDEDNFIHLEVRNCLDEKSESRDLRIELLNIIEFSSKR